jgi:hypothetical protein
MVGCTAAVMPSHAALTAEPRALRDARTRLGDPVARVSGGGDRRAEAVELLDDLGQQDGRQEDGRVWPLLVLERVVQGRVTICLLRIGQEPRRGRKMT